MSLSARIARLTDLCELKLRRYLFQRALGALLISTLKFTANDLIAPASS